jgi:hypothetical protein
VTKMAAFHSLRSPASTLEVRPKLGSPIFVKYSTIRDIAYTSNRIRIIADQHIVDIHGRNLQPLVDGLGKEVVAWVQEYDGDGASREKATAISDIKIVTDRFLDGAIPGLKDGLTNPTKWMKAIFNEFKK